MSTLPPNPITQSARKKITTLAIRQKKEHGEPITMLTGYDYPTALALDQAGIDAILVGDSLGMVVLGYENTLPVTMDVMLHHCRAVARGAKTALLIGDMPFMSYQASTEEAVRNAGRFLQEAGMDAIKLEGGRERLDCRTSHHWSRDPGHGTPRPDSPICPYDGRIPPPGTHCSQRRAIARGRPSPGTRRDVSAWCSNPFRPG